MSEKTINTSLEKIRDDLAFTYSLGVGDYYECKKTSDSFKSGFDAGVMTSIREAKKWCPCGGVILAGTEDCTTPLCGSCVMEFGELIQEVNKKIHAEIRHLKRECKMLEDSAEKWMKDYDKLKEKYEPTELVY